MRGLHRPHQIPVKTGKHATLEVLQDKFAVRAWIGKRREEIPERTETARCLGRNSFGQWGFKSEQASDGQYSTAECQKGRRFLLTGDLKGAGGGREGKVRQEEKGGTCRMVNGEAEGGGHNFQSGNKQHLSVVDRGGFRACLSDEERGL